MGQYEEVVKILEDDLNKTGLEAAARHMGLKLSDGQIELKMLGERFFLTGDGVSRKNGEISEVEALIILNAALSPGDTRISPEWKRYDEFPGTTGHADYFRNRAEDQLASLAEKIIVKKEEILKGIEGTGKENTGGADMSFVLEPFTNIRILCQLYVGDDEFPADSRIFFSANADRFLPPQCLEELVFNLIKKIRSKV